MSTVETSTVAPAKPARAAVRPATLSVGLLATTVLLLVALHVIDAGYVREDVAALQNGDAWRRGGWLAQVVLRMVNLLRDTQVQQTVLSLIAAAVSGTLFAVVYDRMRANGWFVLGAVIVLLALALHAGALYTLTASSRAIPIFVAFAALIPSIRLMEDTGDVQSAIGLGLLLPLLLLASPVTTPLVIPLALAAALSDRDSRRDARAFVAMLLVAILPTVIVGLGILGFVAQAGIDPVLAFAPYLSAFSDVHLEVTTDGLLALVAFAPVLVVPILYCFWPGLPERRHVLSAAAVVALPLYLVVARDSLATLMTPMTPAVALLATFVSWLAVVRLPLALRMLALAMLALSVVLSWTLPGLWEDQPWKAALLSLPAPLTLENGL